MDCLATLSAFFKMYNLGLFPTSAKFRNLQDLAKGLGTIINEDKEEVPLFLQQVINGLIIGMLYVLIALGYTMVYGIIRLINFAHGDIFMIGAYAGYAMLAVLGFFAAQAGFLGLIFVFIMAMLFAGLVGMLIDALAYRPLRKQTKIVLLISSIGVSFVLENVVRVVMGPAFLAFPSNFGRQTLPLGNIQISYIQLAIVIIVCLLMIGLHLFVKKTLMGKAMRAIALNDNASRLMGINVDRVISLTFFIGASLAGAGGVLFGLYYGQISFMMGFTLGLKAFTASVLGGVGNIPGAFVGGITLGLLETFGVVTFGGQWKDAFSFAILIAVLIFKPTGLLGEKIAERM